jgi:hypothetical protein
LERRIGGVKAGSDGFAYRLAPAGQRLAAAASGRDLPRGRRAPEPGERFVRHRLAVGELYVHLHEAAAAGTLTLLDFQAEPACWRSFTAPLRGKTVLKPDAFLRLAAGDYELWWFVEIDLGTVSQATRARQADAYRSYYRSGAAGAVMPRVLWVTKNAATASRAAAAVQPDMEPAGLFVIGTNGRLLELATSHEASPS